MEACLFCPHYHRTQNKPYANSATAVREKLEAEDVTFFHDLTFAAPKAMEADAEKAMRVFAGP